MKEFFVIRRVNERDYISDPKLFALVFTWSVKQAQLFASREQAIEFMQCKLSESYQKFVYTIVPIWTLI